MSSVVACLLCAALFTWGIALVRELWALLDHHACDRRLRRAGLPAWLRARQWWTMQAALSAVLAWALAWSAASKQWAAVMPLALLLGMIWCAPPSWLRWRIRRRRAALRRDLPPALARLCMATHCLAPFEEALQLTLRWGPGGPLGEILQEQLLRTGSLAVARWPRPRVDQPLTPLVAELLEVAREASRGMIDHDEQLRRWQWLLVRSHPAARPAYDLRRRHIGARADAARDVETTL